VTDTVEYEEFEAAQDGGPTFGDDAAPAPVGAPEGAPDIRRLSEIPMELSVEIGRTRTTVGEALELRVGSVVALGRQAGDPVDLLVNGSPIARGEVVVVDERYGLRITEILDGRHEQSLAATFDEDPAAGADDAAGASSSKVEPLPAPDGAGA
jgi:flagellar motor switch protein FliN/FliY